jgi:hypothetical protein
LNQLIVSFKTELILLLNLAILSVTYREILIAREFIIYREILIDIEFVTFLREVLVQRNIELIHPVYTRNVKNEELHMEIRFCR